MLINEFQHRVLLKVIAWLGIETTNQAFGIRHRYANFLVSGATTTASTSIALIDPAARSWNLIQQSLQPSGIPARGKGCFIP